MILLAILLFVAGVYAILIGCCMAAGKADDHLELAALERRRAQRKAQRAMRRNTAGR